MEFKRVLVISPHTDDGELGAGGTIARFAEEGAEIHYLVFSSCGKSLPEGFSPAMIKRECHHATKTLGVQSDRFFLLDYEVRTFPEHRQEILDEMIKFRQKIMPELVLVPSSNDVHQDHQTIHWEALRAFKKEASIWGYEHPWNNLTFTSDIFVRLNEEQLLKKLIALKSYKSQADRSYFNEEYVRSLVTTRGTQMDWQYAEAFELIRLLY